MPDPLLPFGEYKPDISDYEGIASEAISNVVPRGDGYGPFQDLQAFTKSLPATARGFFTAHKGDGSVVIFGATVNKLYMLSNVDFTWSDVSRGGGTYNPLSATAQWQFVQFGNSVFATQQNDVLQVFNLASPTTFVNESGSPPQAAYIAIVGQFLVLLGLQSLPFRMQWSGLGDPTNWTAGVNQSDFQDFTDGGVLKGAAGGEYGVIFQDVVVRQMTYAPGSSYIFQITRICEDQGLLAPYALIEGATSVFFLSGQGFQRLVIGNLPIPIGKERIDRSFFADWDQSQPQLLIGTDDPNASRVYFAYKSINGASGLMDSVLMFDYVLDRWAILRGLSLQWLDTAIKPGTTLEGLDVLATQTIAISGAVAGSANLMLQSNAFGTAPWATTNSSVSSGTKLDPNGVNDAWSLIEDTTATVEHYLEQDLSGLTAGVTYTRSIYVYGGLGKNYISLRLFSSPTTSTNCFVRFNLLTGAFDQAVATGTATQSFSAVQAGRGWWRISQTFNMGNADTAVLCRLSLLQGDGSSNTPVYTGDGVSGVHIFGAQFEQFGVMGGYLPTTTVAVQRVRLTVATLNLPAMTPAIDGAPSPTQLVTGAKISVWNVGGTTEANAENIPIIVVDSTHIDLATIPFVNAYTSGGVIAGPMDAMLVSFDSFPTGTFPGVAGVNGNGQVGFFNGPNLEAKLESAEHGDLGTRIFISGFRPITDAPSAVGSISYRENLQNPRLYTAEQPLTIQGLIPVSNANLPGSGGVSTRYARGKLRIPYGSTWSYALGIEPETSLDGVL